MWSLLHVMCIARDLHLKMLFLKLILLLLQLLSSIVLPPSLISNLL
jgi:hypothetical protein